MSFLRTVFVLMLVLPAYTYASGFTALSGNGMYTEGYYMPSLLENNSFSVRKIKKESASENTSVLPGHDVKLTSSVLAAIGGGVGFGGDGVGLNFSVDYGEFLAKKVSYYWRGADAASETFTKKYEASRISRISSTTLTVSVCYERFTSPSHFSIGLFACAGGGATYCGIAPGNYGKLSPSYKVKSGVLLPLGRSLTLLLGGFYRGAFGDNEYESVYDNAVSLSGKVSVPVASEKWGASGTVSRFELTDLGLELGLRFNLRLDST